MSTTHSTELGADIYVLRASLEDSTNLIAVGTEHSVEVFTVEDNSFTPVASFHIGQRVTALGFSPKTVSPSRSQDWFIEIVAASANFGLHLLTKSSHASNEHIFAFGGGLSGHHGCVNDISFCGGFGDDAARYVATVSADALMLIWDLYPTSTPSSPSSADLSLSPPPRAQPTAYTISFPHELRSVCSHPSSSKEFLVADARGSIFLTDWRSDPEETGTDGWRLFELVDPYALAASISAPVGGCASWKKDNVDIVGAVFGSRFSVWDISRLQGGKPLIGNVCLEGADRFRWSPTLPAFAISSRSPTKGATLNIHQLTHASSPTTIVLAPRPHFVRDFDWIFLRTPRIAAAVGRRIMILRVEIDT
ncbi:WD-REPEATS-REGION domain-containing protein [Mycena indigotica]|uniref:WD-REPEATS-REGION domain-containing protein n=1 Tax=Mycena indigotica TaxID=2126181 RepID=A0A8H6VVB9_9AGAR|nr:WD-REPEATS-REGION domain-containing protein [Mycena indigotica]KAF7295232.1 WD-REPEATS-REGION domain-containing protein [Mycena indigotica]